MSLDAYLGSPQHEYGVLSSICFHHVFRLTLPLFSCFSTPHFCFSVSARVVVLVSGYISTSISNFQLASSLFCFSCFFFVRLYALFAIMLVFLFLFLVPGLVWSDRG